MSRSIYKGPYVNSSLLRKIKKMQALNTDFTKTAIKTWARSSVIIPSFVGKIFEVHNGIKFNKVYIIENMIGHKLGEFSPTRVFARHNHDKYKSNNKNRKIVKKKK